MLTVLQPQSKNIRRTDLRYEHRLWRNELAFCKDELEIMEERLKEIVAEMPEHDVEASVESFQNRFDLQRDHISALKHRIRNDEHFLDGLAENFPIGADYPYLTAHATLRSDVDRFRELYLELKLAFNRFAVK